MLLWVLAPCFGLLEWRLTFLAMTRDWFAIALTFAAVAAVVAAAVARAGHRRSANMPLSDGPWPRRSIEQDLRR